MKVEGEPKNGIGPILEKGVGSSVKKTFHFLDSAGSDAGRVVAKVNAAPVEALTVSTNNIYAANTWQHWTVSYDDGGDRKIRIYRNGVEITYNTQRAASGATTADGSDRMNVGATPGTLFWAFKGSIDEIRIYSRVLAIQEIQAVAAAGP